MAAFPGWGKSRPGAASSRPPAATIVASAALLAAVILPGGPAGADPASAAWATAAGDNPAAAVLVTDPAAAVNPLIGTANDGDDFPGADAPFGMVQWSPDTSSRPDGGGYAYGDSAITGFSLTHLSGPGCRAEGDIPVLPTVGSADPSATDPSATDPFSHADEAADAGYYRVKLDDGITAELTATTRTGMARFAFPATTRANLILGLDGSQRGDSATSFAVVTRTEVQGSATSGNFCGTGNSYTVYFDMQFSQPFTASGTYAPPYTPPQDPPSTPTPGPTPAGPGGARLTFDTTTDQRLLVKVGISYVSDAQARSNLAAENPAWNFAATSRRAHAAWNAVLGRVRVAGASAARRAVFYTALYHSLLHPNVFSDDNGRYRGADGTAHTVDAGHAAFYSNFSGWDMYRAQAQLEALVAPAVASDTAQSMLDDYAQRGTLPKWTQDNSETYVMAGDPADPVIADYYAFGARNFDTAAALADMVAEATRPNPVRPGLGYLDALGYLPIGGDYDCCNYYEPVSTTLEYDTDDFALSAFAGALGNAPDQARFLDRAQDWRNLLNPASGLAQRREVSGQWASGFDPASTKGFIEADSWIYTGMVPFNLAGLTRAKGGRAAMAAYLRTVLNSHAGAPGYAWMGNEPSLELPWEYDYIGEPDQTQQAVRQIQDEFWADSPAGLGDGNDDLGALSAWYVWSALGMYPMTPGTRDLALGSPVFPEAIITLPSGRALTIHGDGATDDAPHVQSATWNSSNWTRAYAPAAALVAGGTLRYALGTRPAVAWASAPAAAPPSYGPAGGTTSRRRTGPAVRPGS